jgi:hypothetical protein
MRPVAALLALTVLVGCAMLPGHDDAPPPAPPVEAAEAHLDEVIDAGIDRDWERLCALASGTCEGELQGFEEQAPTEPPRVVEAQIHEPVRGGDGSWSSGGVLFVLCGTDGLGGPYESEVLVFDDAGRGLLATAAVYWVGTKIGFPASGEDGVTIGVEPDPEPSRC